MTNHTEPPRKLKGRFIFLFGNGFTGMLHSQRKFEIEAADLVEGREQCRRLAEQDDALCRGTCPHCKHIAYLDGQTWRKVVMKDYADDTGTQVETLF